MSSYPAFECLICHQVPHEPRWSLDRRVQKYAFEFYRGNMRTVVHVLDSRDMFVYDIQSCWQVHEPTVIAALQLKTCYPQEDFPANCCRCGCAVDRCMPHVSYTVLCMRASTTATGAFGDVISDEELAVLCPECEEPDLPGMAAALAMEPVLDANLI